MQVAHRRLAAKLCSIAKKLRLSVPLQGSAGMGKGHHLTKSHQTSAKTCACCAMQCTNIVGYTVPSDMQCNRPCHLRDGSKASIIQQFVLLLSRKGGWAHAIHSDGLTAHGCVFWDLVWGLGTIPERHNLPSQPHQCACGSKGIQVSAQHNMPRRLTGDKLLRTHKGKCTRAHRKESARPVPV